MDEKRIPVLARETESGDNYLAYISPKDWANVSPKVLERLNRKFFKLKEHGWFFPTDPMDAYMYVLGRLVKVASKRRELHTASMETYLTTVIHREFSRYHSRVVARIREEYRSSECGCADILAARVGAEDAYNGKNDRLNQNQLVEEASDETTTGERLLARECLASTLPKISEIAAKGLAAWIKADGHLVTAAKIAGVSKSLYYRDFPKWCAEFRAACPSRGKNNG